MRWIALIIAALAFPATAYASPVSNATDAIRAAGFGELADRAGQAARPTVRIGRRPTRLPKGLGTSRLGGPPDLPRGIRWPSCRGRPQTFLGQIRVRDLPPAAQALRRPGGRLWLFTHVEVDSTEPSYGVWAGDCTRIIHAAAGTRLRRTPRPRMTLRLQPAVLRYRIGTDIPDVSIDTGRLSPPLHDVAIPDDRQEAWWEMRSALQQGAPQNRRDPLFEDLSHRLLGYVDPPNGGNHCWERTEDPADAWQHLMTFGYDPGIGFEVADGGRLQVAISAQDLQQGRFDRVCGIFDSA